MAKPSSPSSKSKQRRIPISPVSSSLKISSSHRRSKTSAYNKKSISPPPVNHSPKHSSNNKSPTSNLNKKRRKTKRSFTRRWMDVSQQMLADTFLRPFADNSPHSSNHSRASRERLTSNTRRSSPEASDDDIQKVSMTTYKKQPPIYRNPTLRARVPRKVLEGGTAPPFRHRPLSRFLRAFRPSVAVKIEPLTSGLSTSVLFAPENITSDSPYVRTRLISGTPRKGDKGVVYQDSPFEIRVAGMLVRNFDRWGPSGDNELLMYSIQTDPSTAGDNGQSLPFIHYDFNRDGWKSTERPNTFVPIPASKSYVMGSMVEPTTKKPKPSTGSTPASPSQVPTMNGPPNNECPRVCCTCPRPCCVAARAGSGKRPEMPEKKARPSPPQRSVNVNFRILELDKPGQTIKDAITGIDQLGGFMSGFSTAAPLLGVLSPALGLASAVSRRALDSYAEPDKVISIDMDFLLADRKRVEAGTAQPGEYLRYGYYFFLSEPIEGRLYASVKTPKNVQLMFKRCDVDKNAPRTMFGSPVVSRQYFPLNEVSYLVVRVSEPTGAGRMSRRPIQMQHATQLENLFRQADTEDDPVAVRNAIRNLGKQIGVLSESGSTASTPAAGK